MRLSIEAKVGLVALIAILCIGWIVVWKGDVFLKRQGYELTGHFTNVSGLIEKSEVRYRGFNVGKVIRIEPRVTDVYVYFFIRQGIPVPEDSRLRVAFDGLIGQKYLEIIPGVSTKTLKDKSMMEGWAAQGIVDFVDVGTQNLEESKKILAKVREVTDDPAIMRAVKDVTLNVGSITLELKSLVKQLDLLATSGQENLSSIMVSLNESVSMLKNTGKRLDNITASVEKLTSDQKFINDIKGTASGARETLLEVKEAAARMSKALERFIK